VKVSIPYGALREVIPCSGLLGQLMLAAWSTSDVSINHPPMGNFKYISQPESLRATLLQISNEGYNALDSAHEVMCTINKFSCIESQQILSNIQTLLKTKSDDPNVPLVINFHFERLQSTSKRCYEKAERVVDEFDHLSKLLIEVQVACSYSVTVLERDQKETEKKRKELEIKKETAEKRKQQQEDGKEVLLKQQEEAKEALRKAIKKLPGKLERIGTHALETFLSTITSALSFGISNAIPSVLHSLNAKELKEEKKMYATELNKFEIEISRLIHLEAEAKLKQAMKEIEQDQLECSSLLEQLSNLDKTDDNMEIILKKSTQFIGKLLIEWRKLLSFLKSFNDKLDCLIISNLPELQTILNTSQKNPDSSLISNYISDRIDGTRNIFVDIGQFSKIYIKYSEMYYLPYSNQLNKYSAVASDAINEERRKLISLTTEADNIITADIKKNQCALLQKLESKK